MGISEVGLFKPRSVRGVAGIVKSSRGAAGRRAGAADSLSVLRVARWPLRLTRGVNEPL